MVSLPLAAQLTDTGKPRKANEHAPAPLSPKHEADLLSQLNLERHAMPPSKRAPLDPLSASELENRPSRNSQAAGSVSYHSLVTPSPLPDIPVLLPEHPVSSGPCGMQRSGASSALVCPWPPVATGRSTHSNLVGQQALQSPPLHSTDEENASRAIFPIATCTRHLSDAFLPEPTTTMNKTTRATGWNPENVLQPIRSRTNSLPSVRRPPGDLWQTDSGLARAAQESIDTADSSVYPAPPGLPPRRHELRRSSSVSDLNPHGSVSLSLAVGSQPLPASEPTKAVPPIGAERSRVVSIGSFKSHVQNSAPNKSDPWYSSPPSPGLESRWKDEACLRDAPLQGKVQATTGCASVSRNDLVRLLGHAVRNKYAPKVMSPLSPLRATTPAFDLSADPAYLLRMPSNSNCPSPRYSRSLPRRARTPCDAYQSSDWDTTCVHCQECKRDNLCKRLLSFRYRQQRNQVQRYNRPHVHPFRGATSSVVDDDCIAPVGWTREVFAYEIDEEEKRLWEEIAAITGASPMSFARAGAPCAAALYRRGVDGSNDEGARDDYLDVPDEGLFANESAALFRDVSVY